MAQNDSGNKPGAPKGAQPAGRFGLIFFLVILAIFIFVLFSTPSNDTGKEMSYTEFVSRVTQGQVDSVKILGNQVIQGVLRDVKNSDGLFYTYIPYSDPTLMAGSFRA